MSSSNLLLPSVKWLNINLCCPGSQCYVGSVSFGVENGRSPKGSGCPTEQQAHPEPSKGSMVRSVAVLKEKGFSSSNPADLSQGKPGAGIRR